MAKKKEGSAANRSRGPLGLQGIILGAGKTVQEPVTMSIEKNYMPYAMSVILSRAIPEIDGFKPSHRKLLYTMYKMGLLNNSRTKSANIVGQTMKLNPHGDSAIYETMVRLSRGYEALLHPYVDSKGNFGKFYSRDMAYAASRYTEAKLDSLSHELFNDIDKDTVDFVDNYDNTLKEPTLLPASFPTVLVNANTGIAVGMASNICPFNLKEVCSAAISLLKGKNENIKKLLLAPDFSGGGQILYNEKAINEIYETGRGGIRVRANYTYDKENNCIDITSIPPSTTIEAIIEKIVDLIKKSVIKEINDIRDETGLDGLRITIDLKRNIDADKLMQKLYKRTPLEDAFSCNFNILVNKTPQVLGVRRILEEWANFRCGCVWRRTKYMHSKKTAKLHLLMGLKKILLDIDKAVEVVKNTKKDDEVVPNLMECFKIDEIQAEYVAEIKLRHLNKEYILGKLDEVDSLKTEIEDLEKILQDENRVKEIIISELKEISKKYGKERKTKIIYNHQELPEEIDTPVEDYKVNLFLTKDGYFKKINEKSLRMSNKQKIKDGDKITVDALEANNKDELLFFTNMQQVYKAKLCDFEDTKASVLGEFVPNKLEMQEGEEIIWMVCLGKYEGNLLFFFENGKIAKVDVKTYQTKTNRKKLLNAFNNQSAVVFISHEMDLAKKYLMTSREGKMLVVDSNLVPPKTTKTTLGISAMRLKKGERVISVKPYKKNLKGLTNKHFAKKLPISGALPAKDSLNEDQLKF